MYGQPGIYSVVTHTKMQLLSLYLGLFNVTIIYQKTGRRSAYIMALNIPVGISNFTEIRQNNYYYVDKTNLIYELLQSPGTEVTMIPDAQVWKDTGYEYA